ncbi:DUF6980 family protein [Neobacillus endophyticus]|uniref:DUF6980 family protein n=1 Tax=Neobacillus endophyticus TaxID=2738405 RepID=UPI001FE718EB|nr:hypothetical protein [Neobacillus endophyticus]
MNEIGRNEIMEKHCCEDMADHANFECDIYKNPFKWPDKIIIFDEKYNDYGLINHDDSTSSTAFHFVLGVVQKLEIIDLLVEVTGARFKQWSCCGNPISSTTNWSLLD